MYSRLDGAHPHEPGASAEDVGRAGLCVAPRLDPLRIALLRCAIDDLQPIHWDYQRQLEHYILTS